MFFAGHRIVEVNVVDQWKRPIEKNVTKRQSGSSGALLWKRHANGYKEEQTGKKTKKRKIQWYGYVTRSNGFSNTPFTLALLIRSETGFAPMPAFRLQNLIRLSELIRIKLNHLRRWFRTVIASVNAMRTSAFS